MMIILKEVARYENQTFKGEGRLYVCFCSLMFIFYLSYPLSDFLHDKVFYRGSLSVGRELALLKGTFLSHLY